MVNIIELRPDRSLINSNFEKYQFSADEIVERSEINLQEEVYRIEANAKQDSLLEAKLFAYHNHLFKNPYDGSCWFIDKKWTVWKFNKEGNLNQIHVIHDSDVDVSDLIYNPSIGFTSNDAAVVFDGGKSLKLLSGTTQTDLKVFELNHAEPGVILDVQYVQESSKIVIALCTIASKSERKYTKIILLTYIWRNEGEATEELEFALKEVLNVKGSLDYLRIEDNGCYIHCITQDAITFENPISTESSEIVSKTQEKLKNENPLYCWSQDEDSITIWVKIEEKNHQKVKVNVGPTELSIAFANNEVLKGQWYHRIDENLATWKYKGDKLEIELSKYETGLMWNELLKGNTDGKYIPNAALAAEIHAKLAHLCSESDSKENQPCLGFNAEQLEECDFEGNDNLLQRINLSTQETTHMAMLGVNNHILFTYKTSNGQVVCLRYDHDGCVWVTDRTENDEFVIKNVYVFPGFGYVEASKSNKKLCVSPANGSYVAILEFKRHIFLYEKPKSHSQISRQWIIDLGAEAFPIIGAVAMNNRLIVLTKTVLYYWKIYF